MKKYIWVIIIGIFLCGSLSMAIIYVKQDQAQQEINLHLSQQAIDGTIIPTKELRDSYNERYIKAHTKK